MPNYSEETVSAPYMQRTKIQLETAYSPGSLFTFEGFLTVCESVPAQRYTPMEVTPYAKEQIYSSIDERIKAWYRTAMQNADDPLPFMCVDRDLLNAEETDIDDRLNISQFDFAEPKDMGYIPSVLTFVCNQCKRVLTFKNIADFDKKKDLMGRINCSKIDQQCHWRQLDIVFVHPNGNYNQPEPWRYNYSNRTNDVYKGDTRCSNCNSEKVCLNERSPQLSNRYYYCADCGAPRDTQWIQNDIEWLKKFRGIQNRQAADIRMKAVSYRANSVHYPLQDMTIDFGKNERLATLNDVTNQQMKIAVSDAFSFPVTRIPEKEFETKVVDKYGPGEWNSYKTLVIKLDDFKNGPEATDEAYTSVINALENARQEKEEGWAKSGIVSKQVDLPPKLTKSLEERRDLFSHRYDPFRLLIEHRALLDQIVSDQLMDNGIPYYTAMDHLDQYIGPDDPKEREVLNVAHRKIMDHSGIDTIGLVRKFETLQYSFGFTRVDSKPVTKYINNRIAPVRLKLFEKTQIDEEQKHPIFTLKQNNEAIYVRLKEEVIREWLTRLNTNEGMQSSSIGAQYLEAVPPMGTFLDNLPHEDLNGPSMPLALYSLLHTYAHHVMYAISDFSGLGVGSLGEYIFPADLSFIVYRRGMTMDLGNLTSMLRNNAPAFLKYIEDRTSLGCGSGSLCISRGGACPDCLLIPEVSCITQNKLLSRALLIGKGHPNSYGFKDRIEGYLDVAQEMNSS